MRGILMACLICSTSMAEAQDLQRKGPSPASAQLSSLAAFLIPVAVGAAVILPENASDATVVAGSLIFFTGAIFGPALGFWRGGAAGRGWLGVGVRTGILAVTIASVGSGYDEVHSGAETAAGIGVLGLLAHGIFDVVRVRTIVGRRQAELSLTTPPSWVGGSGVGVRVGW